MRAIRKIAQVRQRIDEIDRALKELQANSVFELYTNHQTALEDDRNLLEEMAAQLDQQIADTQRELDTASPVST